MSAVLVGCALWLFELYTAPTWSKIRSFVLGYFLGTFVMEWIWQRSSRGMWGGGEPEVNATEPSAVSTQPSV
jgi:hypothetical protein